MEDKIKADEDSVLEIKTGSGAMLASARKKQNRTVEEIADELNLSVTQIKTIELDQSEGLPEPTYVRGYIRSYAKLLGLSPEHVLESYLNPNWQKTSSLEDLPRGLGRADNGESRSRFGIGKVLALLLVIAVATYLWLSGALNGIMSSSQSESTPAALVSSPNESNNASEDSSAAESTSATDDTQQAPPPAEADQPTQSEQNQLVLNFAQTSWVDIRDGNDTRLAYKSYAQGEELTVSSANSMSVFIGNAEGVSARYNGEEFDISPFREGVYAKFNLGED